MKHPGYLFAGVVGYLLATLPMVYLAAFVAGVFVPKTVDSGPSGPAALAWAVDIALLFAFALVHSVLARPAAKAWLTRRIPPALERTCYSAIAGAQIVLLLGLWRSVPEPVWRIGSATGRAFAWGAFGLGWAVVAASVGAIGSDYLFGLRQAAAAARGAEPGEPPLAARGPYRWVRHPIYSGTILGLVAAPTMSRGHLLLAGVFTAYVLLGAWFEERELARRFGDGYLEYRRRVPAYLPRLWRRA